MSRPRNYLDLQMQKVTLGDKAFEEYLDAQKLATRIQTLAQQIDEDYRSKYPLFLIVLKGAFLFGSELFKHFTGQAEIEFIKAKSYHGTERSSDISFQLPNTEVLGGRHIIIVEDIVDSGNTLKRLTPLIQAAQPKSIALASLLSKPEVHQNSIKIDYCGFEIPNDFVVGFGLDYNELGRNLGAIYSLVDS